MGLYDRYERNQNQDTKKTKTTITRVEEHYRPVKWEEVQITECKKVVNVRFMSKKKEPIIRRIDKDTYKNLITGEIKKYNHTENRTNNIKNLKQTFKRLRDIINANIEDINKVLFVTLTYAENMTDHKRLYEDFRRFNQKFQRWLQNKGFP